MNFTYLSEKYVPPRILYRQGQVNKILETITDFKKYAKGENILILGRTGSGKTCTIKNLMKQSQGFIRYVSLLNYRRCSELFAFLSGHNFKHTDKIVRKFIEDLSETPCCLVIDEVDHSKEIQELMSRLNHIYRETQIPIILITNNIHFRELLPQDVLTTLNFETLDFPLYTKEELKGILNDRLDYIGYDLQEETKEFMSSIVYNHNRSARTLLETIYRCAKRNNFSQEFIKEQINKGEEKQFHDFIMDQTNPTERKILSYILAIKERNNQPTNDVLVKETNLSRSTICISLKQFKMMGLIKTNIKHYGRGKGPSSIIDVDEQTIEDLKKIPEIYIG